MADKPLKSLNGKKFTGVLAKPIDTGLFMPLVESDPAWPKYLEAQTLLIDHLRREKMQALAHHLGIDVSKFGLADPANGWGLAMLYGRVAIELAARVVPGFQEKSRGKHPREIVRLMRVAADAGKAQGKIVNDLEFCRFILRAEEPDLAKPGRKSELEKRARTMSNLISNDRAAAERAEKALHKKPRLRIVKP